MYRYRMSLPLACVLRVGSGVVWIQQSPPCWLQPGICRTGCLNFKSQPLKCRPMTTRGAKSHSNDKISVADPWHFGTVRIRGSVPLTNGIGFGYNSGSGSGSCYFRLWPSRCQLKLICFLYFFMLITFEDTFTSFFRDKKSERSHKIVGSCRPKNIRILPIRICNTG